MKLLLFFLLLPFAINAQQSTRWQGDSVLSVQLVSYDTSKVKVYNIDTSLIYHGIFDTHLYQPRAKYDTIGPVWRLVSDTTKGWNPASAMQVYEVREYVNQGIDFGGPRHDYIVPVHSKWLDSKKKPLTLKVWEDKQ